MSVFVLQNVYKSFKNDKNEQLVLNNVNLTFPDTGLISILGKSGSGKSTLLNILMGIEKPTKGNVLFEGKNIAKFNDKKFSKYHLKDVSLIFQHYNLFNDLTAFDNVALPLIMRGEKKAKYKNNIIELFKKFNLQKIINQKVSKLSGGEKQRVAIIRAILIKPKAILCDEPTGALDSQNSREIMEILKEISKNTLVIIVSHNKSLVYKFSDKILELKDGKFDSNTLIESNTKRGFQDNEKVSYKSSWINKFFRINLRKNFKKNIFSIIACSISFCSIFISIGFSVGSKISQDEALRKNLSIGYATISESEFIDLEGSPLSFQKTKRPELALVDEKLGNFNSIRCEENISYLISNSPVCSFEDSTFSNFQMVPVYDISLKNYGLDMLKEGIVGNGTFEEIIVNKEFANLFKKDMLNKCITISNSATINYNTGDEENPFIKDILNIQLKLKIVGILHEFSFLNTPKIYFSYNGAKHFLRSEIMPNLSAYFGKYYSYFDYIADCKNDDSVCSYSYYLFLDNLEEIDEFYDVFKNQGNSNLQITSSAFQIKDTYTTFISSFSTTLFVFIVIAFIGVNFILGMISLSTFIENKKQTAIMTCLGAKNKSIYKLYINENILLILTSLGVGIGIAVLSTKYLNILAEYKFGLENIVQIPFRNFMNIPYGMILGVLLIAVLFSLLFTLTPMLIYRSKSITDELRDE